MHVKAYRTTSVGAAAIAAAFLFFAPGALFAQAPAQVQAVVAKMNSLGGFRANVNINGQSGVLSYQGGRFHFQLSDGRVLASNGRSMVAYNPGSRVAGRQTAAPGGGGLGWLLSGFEYRVSGMEAVGRAIDPGASMREVKVAWGPDNILRRLSIRYRDSETWFVISLSNVRQVSGFSTSLFSYKPPAGSRTVENPLDESN